MPATKDGVDGYVARNQPLDLSLYAALLKANGVGVRDGDKIMITKIKVKKKHVEFRLGGGYGTVGDETDSRVYVPSAEKTRREKNLERELKDETDDRRRRRLREELSDLLPRLKAIHSQKLYRLENGKYDEFAKLQPELTRAIDWKLIRQQYQQMVKYATALRLGTAETEAILRRAEPERQTPDLPGISRIGQSDQNHFFVPVS